MNENTTPKELLSWVTITTENRDKIVGALEANKEFLTNIGHGNCVYMEVCDMPHNYIRIVEILLPVVVPVIKEVTDGDLKEIFDNYFTRYEVVNGKDFVYAMDFEAFKSAIKNIRINKLSSHDSNVKIISDEEMLTAFIKEIKAEFKDENWDYLDFIAERLGHC